MRQFRLSPKRSFSQNFLIDPTVCRDLVQASGITRDEQALEIGPGLGILTAELVAAAGRVTAIELDRDLEAPLRSRFGADNDSWRLILGDALAVDLNCLIAGWPSSCLVFSNLPYSLTTPLIRRLVCSLPGAAGFYLMVQKDVWPRLADGVGERCYGPLAALVASFGMLRRIRLVSRTAFRPQPQVDSCLVALTRRETSQLPADPVLWAKWRRFLDDCFSLRRKTLINSLTGAGRSTEHLTEIRKFLQTKGRSALIRAEQMHVHELLELFLELNETDSDQPQSSI